MIEYKHLSSKEIIDSKKIKQFSKPNNWIASAYLINHFFWLSVLILPLVYSQQAGSILAALASFILYSSIFNFLSPAGAMHEFCHGRVFSHTGTNQFIYKCLGYLTWTNPTLFRLSHFNHHKKFLQESDLEGSLGNITKPTLLQILFLIFPNPKIFFKALYYNLLTALGIFKNARLKRLIDSSNKKREIRNDALAIFIFHFCIAMISCFFHSFYPTLLLSLPTFCGRYLTFVLASSQHNVELRRKAEFNQVSASVDVKLPLLLRAWYWNMNFHSEHHFLPSVPHYNLKKLSDYLHGEKMYVLNSNSNTFVNEITGKYVKN